MAQNFVGKTMFAEGPFIGLVSKRLSRDLRFDAAEDTLNMHPDGSTLRSRPGITNTSVAPNGGMINAIHDYIQTDGTNILLVHAGQQLYKVDRAPAAHVWTAIGGATDLSNLYSTIFTVNNRAYIAHDGVPKVTDGTTLENWLITRPTLTGSATVFNVNSFESFNFPPGGEWDYKVTYYSSTWGLESPASDLHYSVGPLSEPASSITLNSLPVSADSRVDLKRIYRRRVDANEADWFLVKEVANGTATYVDNEKDIDRSLSFVAPLSFNPALPEYWHAAFGNGIVVGTEFVNNNQLYFSVVGSSVPLGFLNTEDEITAIEIFQSVIVVFTKRSIWVLSGNSPETFSFQKVVPDRGCVSRYGAVVRDEGIYFASNDGIYLYPLGTPIELTEDQQPTWLARDASVDSKDLESKLLLAFDMPTLGGVGWAYSSPSAGSNNHDKVLTYYYRNSQNVGVRSWFPWSFTNLRYLKKVRSAVDGSLQTLVGLTDGTLGELGGNDDDGSDINCYWQTAKFDRNRAHVKKHWGDLSLDVKGQSTTEYVDVSVLFDDDEQVSAENIGHIKSSDKETFVTRIGGDSKQIRFRFEQTASNELQIHSYSIDSILAQAL